MRPTLEPEAARLYQQIEPLAREDANYGWAAAHLGAALMGPIEDLAAWAKDEGDRPGYAILTDVDNCPPIALPWLAQLQGVVPSPSDTIEEERRHIKEARGRHRGIEASLISDVQSTLTGSKYVSIRYREGGPFEATVVVREIEMPSEAATEAAMNNPHGRPWWMKYTLEVISNKPLISEWTRDIELTTADIESLTIEDVV